MAGGYLWTDYEYANVDAFDALLSGDWERFFAAAPIEGPSLLMRAPFAALPSLWDGGHEAIFRTVAIPGLLAGAVLGVLLLELRRRAVGASGWGWVVLLLAAANPITLQALEVGHPEELFGAVLCITAVIAALHDRPVLAAVLLGLALANKAWAVLAIGPVLLALPAHRLRVFAGSGAIALLFATPFLLDPDSRAALASAGTTDAVFQPWQVFWFLGESGEEVRGFGNILKPDYRSPPGWIAQVTHPLIALLVLPASWLWLRRRGERSVDLLLLLAGLLLARCVFDVANNVYYHLPFLLALLAWEALRAQQPPVWTLAATGAVWFTCVQTESWASPDLQSALYVAWVLPAFALLARTLFAGTSEHRAAAPARLSAAVPS